VTELPSVDCTGAVIGGRWSLLEVVAYVDSSRKWLLRCLACGRMLTRPHSRVMTHAWRDGNPTNYCPSCRYEGTKEKTNE
jgi:hypothetical protein